jgi:hypothetical protein
VRTSGAANAYSEEKITSWVPSFFFNAFVMTAIKLMGGEYFQRCGGNRGRRAITGFTEVGVGRSIRAESSTDRRHELSNFGA